MIVISMLPNAYCFSKALITSFIKQLLNVSLLLEVGKVPVVASLNRYGFLPLVACLLFID